MQASPRSPYDGKEVMENGSSPVTKNDFEQLRSETKEGIEQLRSETKEGIGQLRSETKEEMEQIRSEMAHMHHDVIERISDTETKLLTAFYSFAQSNSKRMWEMESNEGALRSRMATLEDRLTKVEKRLNIPPAA
jgi:hypothetical protein